MRNVFFYIAVITMFIALNSCCNKRYCEGFYDQYEISFFNFTGDDVDSVSIEIFQIGPNGKLLRNSSLTKAYQTVPGKFSIRLIEYLNQNREYKVTLSSKGLGSVYVLSNFVTKSQSCNNCFPKGIVDDDFVVLDNYQVNGIAQYYKDLRIIK